VLKFFSSEKVELSSVAQAEAEPTLVNLEQVSHIGSQLTLEALDGGVSNIKFSPCCDVVHTVVDKLVCQLIALDLSDVLIALSQFGGVYMVG